MKYSITEINSDFSFSGIYKWENEINGKVYIGQSINIYNRFLDYKKGRFNPHMKSAINKYGIDNFSIEILEKDIDETNPNAYEQKWIDFYQSYLPENGYNIAPVAGNTRGVKKSKTERDAMSKRASKRIGELNPFYGKHHTEETRKKISEAHKGLHYEISEENLRKWREGYRASIDRIKQIDKNTNEVIAIYENAIIASKQTDSDYSGIRRCCQGKQKTCNGYRWQIA